MGKHVPVTLAEVKAAQTQVAWMRDRGETPPARLLKIAKAERASDALADPVIGRSTQSAPTRVELKQNENGRFELVALPAEGDGFAREQHFDADAFVRKIDELTNKSIDEMTTAEKLTSRELMVLGGLMAGNQLVNGATDSPTELIADIRRQLADAVGADTESVQVTVRSIEGETSG